MIDVSGFLAYRLLDLVTGLLLGAIIGIVVALVTYFMVEEYNKKTVPLLAFLISTIVLGIIFFLAMFLAELAIISYVDLINDTLGVVFFALLLAFVGLISFYGRQFYQSGRSGRRSEIGKIFSNLNSANAIGGFIGVMMFFGFFGFIIFLIFFEDLSVLFFLIFLGIIIAMVVMFFKIIRDKNFRHLVKVSITHSNPVFLITLVGLSLLIASTGYLSFIYAGYVAPINQANYFDGFIETSFDDHFVNPVKDDQVRLVDRELAQAIVDRNSAEFGASIKARSLHVTTYNGRLVWVAAMAPDNIFNQELSGLFIVDANDPQMDPIKIDFAPGEAIISENLFYGAETKRVAWLKNRLPSYGRTYITWNDVDNDGDDKKDMIQIQTFNNPQLLQWLTIYGGVQTYDLKGNLLETFTDPDTIPGYVAQPFDEYWLESNINNWGNLRQGSGFDIFAPGFLGILTPSSDRLEISRDTRYIISPDTNEVVAITPLHPITNELSNAGLFVTTNNKITYYDYSNRSYISSEAIEQFVESKEIPPAQGEYYATLPMLYEVNVSSTETRMAWYTPVYYKTGSYVDDVFYTENIQFHALYVIDAINEQAYGRAYISEGTTSQMIIEAKNHYITRLAERGLIDNANLPSTNDTNYISVNITKKAFWVENGTSFIAFKTNNTQYETIIATPDYLNRSEWLYALIEVDIGTEVLINAENIDSIWYIVDIRPS